MAPSQYTIPTSSPRPVTASSATVPRCSTRAPARPCRRSERPTSTNPSVRSCSRSKASRRSVRPSRRRRRRGSRLPGQLSRHGRPGAHRRQSERGAEPEVTEPGDPLQIGIDDEEQHRDGPEPAHEADRAGRRRRGKVPAPRRRAPGPGPARASPQEARARPYRELRASSSASISRFSPIASVQAPTIATVTQSQSAAEASRRVRAASPRRRTARRRRCARASPARRSGAGARRRSRSRLPVRRLGLGEQAERMPERRPQHRIAVPAAAGRAGQVDPERARVDTGDPTRSTACGVSPARPPGSPRRSPAPPSRSPGASPQA